MMGKRHNQRMNPNKPLNERIMLTTKQLNTRAIITARQVLDGVLTISENLGIGPILVGNAMNGDTLVTFAGWRFQPNYEKPPKPDVIVHFVPNLTKDMGELMIQPFYAPWDWPNKTEIVERLSMSTAQIQAAQADTTSKVKNDLDKQRRQGGVYFQ